jgi:homoserine kinase type II
MHHGPALRATPFLEKEDHVAFWQGEEDEYDLDGLCPRWLGRRPRAHSQMSAFGNLSEQELSAILAGYNLGRCQDCAYVQRGYVNEKWLLQTAKSQYLLKRRHTSLRGSSLVQAQHLLVRHLRHQGFPAPALVPTRYSDTFLLHEDQVYELQEYVPGDPFDAAEPVHLAAAARMLAFYHQAVRGFDHQALHRSAERYGPAALSRTVKCLLQSWEPSLTPPDDIALLKSAVQELEGQVRDLERHYPAFGPLPELVIHGDYHGANLVFQQHRIVAVVDYDLAHWCSRAMEVAEAIIAFCTEPGLELKHIVYLGALDLEGVNRFMTAYLDEALLSEAEIHALPAMIRTIWLCASLDPPLEPPLSRKAAPLALPEILTLADWALAHASELLEVCLAAREAQAGRPHSLSD